MKKSNFRNKSYKEPIALQILRGITPLWVLLIALGLWNWQMDPGTMVTYRAPEERQILIRYDTTTSYMFLNDIMYPITTTTPVYKTERTGKIVKKTELIHNSLIYDPIVGFFYGGVIWVVCVVLYLVIPGLNRY